MKSFFLLSVLTYAGLCLAGELGSSSGSLEKRNSLIEDELRDAENPFAKLSEKALGKISGVLYGITLFQKLVDPEYCGMDGEVKQVLKEYNVILSVHTDFGIFWKTIGLLRELEEQQRITNLKKYKDVLGYDMVNIRGLDKAMVMKALFDNAQTTYFDHTFKWGISEENWRGYTKEQGVQVSKIEGRMLNVSLSGNTFNAFEYDRYNGHCMAQAAIAALRAREEY